MPFLDLTYAGNVSLSNLRFRYADIAVGAPYYSRLDVWDSQFVQCNASVLNEFGGTDGFHNVLFAGCYDAVAGDTNAYAVEMEQVTADVSNVWDSTVPPSRLALTNAIVFGSVGSVSGYSAQNVTVAPAATEFKPTARAFIILLPPIVAPVGNYEYQCAAADRISAKNHQPAAGVAAVDEPVRQPDFDAASGALYQWPARPGLLLRRFGLHGGFPDGLRQPHY